MGTGELRVRATAMLRPRGRAHPAKCPSGRAAGRQLPPRDHRSHLSTSRAVAPLIPGEATGNRKATPFLFFCFHVRKTTEVCWRII